MGRSQLASNTKEMGYRGPVMGDHISRSSKEKSLAKGKGKEKLLRSKTAGPH